ncbi:tyrosine kinase receptor Cad96Ca-like [Ptychodera flava]|uniref:tyrosine kinase receptor Cad96Ca-like n=1 Tax=Ptychodera flava TaxID=63121 RepID=UPI00396A922A
MCWRRRVQRRAMEDYKDIENQPCLNQDKGEAAPNVCINNNNRATGDRKLCQAMVQKKADDTTTLLESPTSIIASPESGSDVTSDQTEATMGGYKYRSRRSRDSGYVEHISSSTELSSSEESNILEEMPTHEDDTTSTTSTVSSGTTSSEDSLSDRPLESGYSHAERGCEVSRADIEMGELLGEGRFGKVFKGRATLPGKSEHSEVAVKQLPACSSAEEYKDLIRELDVMKKLKPHPRVVRLLASCTLPREDPIYVIVEYVSNGSLKNYLQKNSSVNSTYTSMTNAEQETTLTNKDLVKFALQVAEGMDYLHRNNCIHRDLAARNILVTSDINCKISDFGLARNIGPNQEYVTRAQGPLPLRWEAPESLTSNVYNFKSDVWSYGILLWEIVTFGKRPYPDLDSCEDVRRKVKKGCTMAVPEHCHKGLRAVMQKCWQRDAQKRPSFDKIVSQLET